MTRRGDDVALPTGDEKARTVRRLFDTIAPRYDLVNRVMTFGMDVGWRRRAVRELRLPGGSLVLDLACGTGDLCNELAADGYRAVGFDFSQGMLTSATTTAPLVQADIESALLARRDERVVDREVQAPDAHAVTAQLHEATDKSMAHEHGASQRAHHATGQS